MRDDAVLDSPPAETVPLARSVFGSGPPLLLIAGTGYSGATWPDGFVGPLAERFTVITFDHRGTGATPSTPGPYSIRQFAADALALLRELDLGPALLLGHSMGGRVAQWMALDGPRQTDRLVLVGSGPGQYRDDLPQTRGIPLQTALGLIEQGYREYLSGHIERTFFTPDFAARHPEAVTWLVETFFRHGPSLEDYLKHVIARQQHQTAHLLGRLSLPTLVLVGDHDNHMGGTGTHLDQAHFLAANIPNATFRILDGCAHGYFWQQPEITLAALFDWLDVREA